MTNSWQEIYARRTMNEGAATTAFTELRSVFPWFEDEFETIETLEE